MVYKVILAILVFIYGYFSIDFLKSVIFNKEYKRKIENTKVAFNLGLLSGLLLIFDAFMVYLTIFFLLTI